MPGLWKFRYILSGLAAFALLATTVIDADAARRGGFGGFGSRGSKTYQAPPATQTAPNAASPINRSVTQPQAPRPGSVGQAGAAQKGGLFNRPGFMGGMMAGFLGAGLLGLLLGNGLLGGLSGLAGFLGLLIQVALVVVVARLLWTWWQRRQQQQPGYATAAGPSMRDNNAARDNAGYERQPMQPAYGGGSGMGSGAGVPMVGGGPKISNSPKPTSTPSRNCSPTSRPPIRPRTSTSCARSRRRKSSAISPRSLPKTPARAWSTR